MWDGIKDVGDAIWDAVKPYASQIVYTAVFVGLTAFSIDPITASMIAGAAGGAVSGADKGGLEGAIMGAFTGGALGAFSGAFGEMQNLPDLFRTGLSFGMGLMQNQMMSQLDNGGGASNSVGASGNGPAFYDNYPLRYGGSFDFGFNQTFYAKPKVIQLRERAHQSLQIAKKNLNTAGIETLPKFSPPFSDIFSNSDFWAPVADIIAGGLEAGASIGYGAWAIYSYFAGDAVGPEFWAVTALSGGYSVLYGWDAIGRITTAINRLQE